MQSLATHNVVDLYDTVLIVNMIEASLTAESTRALAVVSVSIQGTVCTSAVSRVLLTVMTVVVTQTGLCSQAHSWSMS